MSQERAHEDFFVAGGTMAPEVPSYVVRPADEELYRAVKRGEFCYVLTARQMGKSSLTVRTARRLEREGAQVAIIDLTQIGAVNPESWYLDFVSELAWELELETEAEAWWREHAAQGYVRRFTNFLRDVVLVECTGNVAIFVDEIDFTLSLDFSDEFFAAIRAVYNNRSRDRAFARLTFVLLGVAAPADLVRDQTRTPFNIGRPISLADFDRADSAPLQQGLEATYPGQGAAILTRIFYWTDGHPYLTQKLCKAIVDTQAPEWNETDTDRLVNTLFLRQEASKEANLAFVRQSILHQPERRKMLTTYRQVYRGKQVADDERSQVINQLKLAGLVKSVGGFLQTRNEIYRQVFDEQWVAENTAIDWTRVAAAGLAVILMLVLSFFGHNAWQAEQVEEAALAFYSTSSLSERRELLRSIFIPPGLFRVNSYDFRGQELFFSMTPAEQIALFRDDYADPTQLEVIVRGVYETMADTDGRNSTWPVLNAMRNALPVDTALHQEITYWLDGRKFWRQRELDAALEAYTAALDSNPRNPPNPALLYERARVLLALGLYPEAASDLESLVAIAAQQEVPEPTVTAPAGTDATGTSVTTVTPTVSATETTDPDISRESPATPTGIADRVTGTPTPTATPQPAPITSPFRGAGAMISAVREMIASNPDFLSYLVEAEQDYPNLQEFTESLQTNAAASPTTESLQITATASPTQVLELSDSTATMSVPTGTPTAASTTPSGTIQDTTAPTPLPTPDAPDLIVSDIVQTDSAYFTNDGQIAVPMAVTIRNQGGAPADIFKISVDAITESGRFLFPFTVPGQDSPWYPFMAGSLAAGDSVTFVGEVLFTDNYQGQTVELIALADSCAGEEFAPPHCRVDESNEDDNESSELAVTLRFSGEE